METGEQCQPTVAEMWTLLREQQEQIAALKAHHDRSDAEREQQRLEKVELAHHDGGEGKDDRRLSRAGLLKAAAAGMAGVAGVGALGLGASGTALAADPPYTGSNFKATGFDGGGGTAFDAPAAANFSYGLNAIASSYGVFAYCTGNGDGVYGTSSSGYGGEFSGGLAPLHLAPMGIGAPTSGSHLAGEVVVDRLGRFYICTTDGTSGTWKQLKITDQGLHSFPDPRRVFGDGSVIAAGTITAAIDVTGAGVPAGASSAYCAVQATNPGVMTLFPDGATDPAIANWANTGAAGQLALFYMLVPLSAAGKFKIHTYLTGQVYVDVWGYLL